MSAAPAGAGPADGDAGDVHALRERISALCAASVRISASLGLPTLLGEIVDSARALTGARYGADATINADGQPEDFVTRGASEAEHRRLLEWPDGPRLFERRSASGYPSARETPVGYTRAAWRRTDGETRIRTGTLSTNERQYLGGWFRPRSGHDPGVPGHRVWGCRHKSMWPIYVTARSGSAAAIAALEFDGPGVLDRRSAGGRGFRCAAMHSSQTASTGSP